MKIVDISDESVIYSIYRQLIGMTEGMTMKLKTARRHTEAEKYSAANETNPLINPDEYWASKTRLVSLKELSEAGGRVSRLRILSTSNRPSARYEISYCHGTIDGQRVIITGLETSGFLGRLKADLVNIAEAQGVHAKRLGLLDETNWSILS